MTISIEKVTNAELHQIINKYEKGQCAVIAPKTDYRIAKELLAVREAQPVASTTKSNIDAVLGGVSTVIWPVRCFKGEIRVDLYTAPPALPDNVIGRSATPDDSPYPATIAGGCWLAQAWADGYNVRNAVTAAPAPAVPDFGALTKLIVGRLIDCGTANDDSIADAEVFVYNACRAEMLNHSGGSTEKVPAGFKLVPVELLSTASMLIDLCRTHTTLNGGGTYNQRVLSDCETTMNAIAILAAVAPTPTKAVPDA